MAAIGGDKQLQSWWTLAATLPESRRTRVVSGARGLYARLHASGAQQWLLRYQWGGKAKVMVIGRWPDLSLAEARRMAAAARVQLDQGLDPAEQRRARREAQMVMQAARKNTLASVGEEWMAIEFANQKAGSVAVAAIRRNILRHIGDRPLGELKDSEVLELLNMLAEKVGAPTARRALGHLKRLYMYAIRRRLVQVDPTAGLRPKDAGPAPLARERVLNDAELRSLFLAMFRDESLSRENAIAVELLLLTGVRKMELLGAQVREFDLDAAVWEIPGERMKTGGGHLVPLVPRVVDLVRELIVRAAGSDWLFPARRISKQRRRRHVSPDTLNFALSDLCEAHKLPHFTVHDLRRTCRSLLARLGVDHQVAELILSHTLRGVVGVYNRYDYMIERRRALERVESHLSGLISPPENS